MALQSDYLYQPDYAVPPGWILEERLAAQGISHAEFARRCGRSAKLVSEIIAGKAPLEPQTALQFEKVLGVDAEIWLGIEKDHQLHRLRMAEAEDAALSADWAASFPLEELVDRGAIPSPGSPAAAVPRLLAFFGVASVEAWQAKFERANIAFRHSPSFKSEKAPLATWLRLGELAAERQECADFDPSRFKAALSRIRHLTRLSVDDALETAQRLCNEAGVALVLVKPLPGTALSGAAWWLSPKEGADPAKPETRDERPPLFS